MTRALLSPEPIHAPPRRDPAPLLAFWRDLAPLVTAMLKARPTWGARLVLAPPEALHALAAYLRHRLAIDGAGVDAATLAASVDNHHVRDLLREAVPNGHPRFYRLLAKCGPRAQDLGTYVAINAILHGTLGAALLRRHLVTASTVALVLRLAADPVLAACSEGILQNEGHLCNLETALILLRAHGLAREIEDVPEGSGWRAVMARIAADIGSAECPPAPFPTPAGWSQPRRWSEISAIGHKTENCLASPLAYSIYLDAWIAGRMVILVGLGGGGLATVQQAGRGVWWISEMSLHQPRDLVKRHEAEEKLRDGLAAAVEAGGGRMADSDPWACIAALFAAADR